MWLFVDETWSPDGFKPKFGILLGVLVPYDSLGNFEDLLFSSRKKYFGIAHAKDIQNEINDPAASSGVFGEKIRKELAGNQRVFSDTRTLDSSHIAQ